MRLNNDITTLSAIPYCEKSVPTHHKPELKSRLTDTRREQTKFKSRSDAHTRTEIEKLDTLSDADVSTEKVIVLL